MSVLPTREDLDRFRTSVGLGLGLHFDDGKLEFLAGILQRRLDVLEEDDAEGYLARLERDARRDELRALAEPLTVGETYFFRNPNDLAAFTSRVLPDRMRARAASRRLRILSAGCSTGEEPCTLAMLIRDVPELASWDVAIHAVDVNPAAIARARSGRYSEWALRQTPPHLQARFFRRAGRDYVLDAAVRRMVSFEERNLAGEDEPPWPSDVYDVVFCRNVTMYFSPEVTRRVVGGLARALAPGGYLFLGHAETLRGVSTAFHLCHSHGTFYYQLRADGVAPDPPPARAARLPPEAVPEIVKRSASWVDAIRRASDRIVRLTDPPVVARPPGSGGPHPHGEASRHSAIVRALELVRNERYAAALAALPAAGGDAEPDRDELLLRAVLLAISGAPGEAEELCRRILARDELSAEAHYVMALCREHGDDRAAAANHDRYAIYLDGAFAMPRLHLGLMALRGGDADAARRELSRALVLLAYEDASRILLLGGGFARDALLDLCRAELRACGGTG